MHILLDAFYLFLLLVLSPWLTYKALTIGKYRRGLWTKFLGLIPRSSLITHHSSLTCWFHGVSVGEIHLLQQVVAAFRRRHPDWKCVISTTTDTGMEEARKRFPDCEVIYWPLDFSWAVRRALRQLNPDLMVLAEGELWPNFLLAAKERGIPVAVINGRISPRSFRRHRFLRPLVAWLLARIDLLAVQTHEYAERYRELRAPPGRIHVTGSVKYDGVSGDRNSSRTCELRELLGVRSDDLVWIAGSTQAPEEQIALDIYRRACAEHPNLRLFLVPRQKDRFEEVARMLERSGLPFVRRSELGESAERGARSAVSARSALRAPRSAVVLVDTIGELSALWGLADVAFVGGSLDGKRGGQNMIEPAAYGAAVVFGPHVWNFRDTAERLVAAAAAIQVRDAGELDAVVRRLLKDADERSRLGEAARQFVRSQQGATERTIDLIDQLIATRCIRSEAA
ncbi:MAG TPA: 3-deoxy-D-manno-octulosonic acid transferase [Gemmataceae bacterium]|nr:3-deoxy-D-manno-octulosonic acid transferase [Gemmataceae bacterium]